jgi:hypothetical protein
MKKFFVFILFLSIALIPCVGQGDSQSPLSPTDNTKKWKYPYEVDAKRANELHDGMVKLADLAQKNRALSSLDAINILGAPDMVTDLESAFAGLSVKEDGYLVEHKPELKWRLVWFLKKNNKLHNANDIWIGVYIKKDSDQIVNFILN